MKLSQDTKLDWNLLSNLIKDKPKETSNDSSIIYNKKKIWNISLIRF